MDDSIMSSVKVPYCHLGNCCYDKHHSEHRGLWARSQEQQHCKQRVFLPYALVPCCFCFKKIAKGRNTIQQVK